jgi:hypothetical protein
MRQVHGDGRDTWRCEGWRNQRPETDPPALTEPEPDPATPPEPLTVPEPLRVRLSESVIEPEPLREPEPMAAPEPLPLALPEAVQETVSAPMPIEARIRRSDGFIC